MKTKFYSLNTAIAAFNDYIKKGWIGIKQLGQQSTLYRLPGKGISLSCRHKLVFVFMIAFCFSKKVLADYTVAAGTTVNASTLTSQGGVLTINGTLNVDISTVSLLNFTRVVIDGANAQIFWIGNGDLKFAAGISFVISNTSLGLQPVAGNGNASTRLYIGPTVIIVSSDNSQNAAFSFEIFNYIGGLPEFTLTTSPTTICYGAAFTATLTPLCDKINYDCSWSVSPSSGTSMTPAVGSTLSNFNVPQTYKFTYPTTPQSYTLTYSIARAGAGVAFASASVNVSVNHVPAPPTLITSSPATVCAGSNLNINATTSEGIIQWYTVASGGTSIGSTASAVNFPVSPVVNTTYYAGATIVASGCASSTRVPLSVAVSQPPVGGSITGGTNVCTGANNTLLTLTGYTGTIQWQQSSDNSTFANLAGYTGTSYSATNLTATKYYRALLTSGVCPSTSSAVSAVLVNPVSVAGSVNGAVTVCAGTNSTLLTLSGNTGTIQWQSSPDNNSFGNLIGATAPTLTVSNLTATTYYRSVVTSGLCAAAISSAVPITVTQSIAGGTIDGATAVCSGVNNTSLTLSNNIGNVVKWQSSTVSDFTGNEDIASTSLSLTLTNISSPRFYRAMITNACGIAYSAPAFISIHNLWEGTQSADWNVAANWSGGELPSISCQDVIIAAGTPFNPVLGSGTATIYNLVIQPGAALTVSNARLQIAGTITNAGTFNVTLGTLAFNGNFSQSLSGNMLFANTLKNLVVSNNLVINNASDNFLNLTGDLSFGDVDNKTLTTGDNLILVSTAVSTARVADITNNGINNGNKVIGKAAVQRYLPARRSWRLFTAPVARGGTVFDNWQNGGVFQAGKGTYVSGPGATSPSGPNGLDWSPLNNASLKAGSVPVLDTRIARLSKNSADTSDNIPYFIFARGDRDPVNTNPANSNITTLTSVGQLQTGRQTFAASSAAGAFTLIGNPYASPVDFAKIGRNNVSNRFYAWDPYLNAEQGGYVIFDDVNNTGTYSYTSSNLTPILQSGQAFYAITINNGPASVVFQENTKTASNNLQAYRTASRPTSFRANLYYVNEMNALVLLDGTLALFDNNFSKGTDKQDALKMENIKEMLSLQRDSIALGIERRPIPAMDDTLFLLLTKTTPRRYRLGFEPGNLDTNLVTYLEDRYTGKKIQLSAAGASVYDFDITLDKNSAMPGRFRILFKPLTAKPLIISNHIIAFSKGGNIEVAWEVDNDINASRYEVEKSANLTSFVKVNSTVAGAQGRSLASYKWLDENPFKGNNYYRIRCVDASGNFVYSKTVLVTFNPAKESISISPNPVTDNIIRADFNDMPAGVYNLKLLNNFGQVVFTSITTRQVAGSWKQTLRPAVRLTPGIYQLKVTVGGKQTQAIKLIVE
ncbi:MAG: C-terminal target protein [Ferruginibacter sp.]|nr:C-terminal target protein [Ferruginibacter sp.]